MTADHWDFVVAAYGVALVALGGYWRRLVHLERTLKAPTLRATRAPRAARRPAQP
jgi:hypothetical protein